MSYPSNNRDSNKKHGYTKSSPLITGNSTPQPSQMRNVASSTSIFSSFLNGDTSNSLEKHKRVRSTGFFPMEMYRDADAENKKVSSKESVSRSRSGWDIPSKAQEKGNLDYSQTDDEDFGVKRDDLSSLSSDDQYNIEKVKKAMPNKSLEQKKLDKSNGVNGISGTNGEDPNISSYVSPFSMSHVASRKRNYSISSTKTDKLTRYGRKPRAEVYGFIGWLTSAAAFIVYLIWAFLPEELLHRFGWTYFPSKYWASAIPSFLCWLWIWYWIGYIAHIHWRLPALNRYESFCDEYSALLPPGEDSKVVLYDSDIHANYVAKSFESLQVAPMRDLGIVSETELVMDYDDT